jgi:hypothetical protein
VHGLRLGPRRERRKKGERAIELELKKLKPEDEASTKTRCCNNNNNNILIIIIIIGRTTGLPSNSRATKGRPGWYLPRAMPAVGGGGG